MSDLATGLALVLVLEGILWALATDSMKRAALMAVELDNNQLRAIGLIAAAVGVFVIWLLRA
ncbi:MAG: DUF2065 domain-containing protein [Geminicoccaceae bacterium]